MLPTPLPMKKIKLYMVDVDAQKAAMTLARMGVIHPLETNQAGDELDEFPAAGYHEVYHNLNSRYGKIIGYVERPFSLVAEPAKPVTIERLQALDDNLRELWARVSEIEEQLRRQAEKINGIRQLSGSLQKFASLDLDLGRLRRRGQFLRIFVGTVPSPNFEQLKRALSLLPGRRLRQSM